MRSTIWTSELVVSGLLALLGAGCPAKSHAVAGPTGPDAPPAPTRLDGDGFSIAIPPGWEIANHKTEPKRQALANRTDGTLDGAIDVEPQPPPGPVPPPTEEDCQSLISAAQERWGQPGKPATAELLDGPGGPTCAVDTDGVDAHNRAIFVFHDSAAWLMVCTTPIGDTALAGACDVALAGWHFAN